LASIRTNLPPYKLLIRYECRNYRRREVGGARVNVQNRGVRLTRISERFIRLKVVQVTFGWPFWGVVPVTLQNLFENAIIHNTIEDESPLIISVYVEGDFLVVKNTLQKKKYVETSNKQGLESLKKLYTCLTSKALETYEAEQAFVVRVPLV
jgi:hypothetical protein